MALCLAALLATGVAWASPRQAGGRGPSAELTWEGGGHVAPSTGPVRLVERIRPGGIAETGDCEVVAALHLLDEDGTDGGPLLSGTRELRERVPARPGPTGEVEVTFEIDASGLAGRTVACLATMERGGVTVARWDDVADGAQAVRLPSVTASVPGPSRVVSAIDGARLDIEVGYANVEPGSDYAVTATLLDACSGEALRDSEGRELASAARIRPKAASGSAAVGVAADARSLGGRCVAVRTELSRGADVLAEHLTGCPDTIYFPRIESAAREARTGLRCLPATAGASVSDEVAYEGLAPGTPYVLTSALVDADTGDALEDDEGDPIVCSYELTPTEPSGTVLLTHSVDATGLAGRRVALRDALAVRGAAGDVAGHDGAARGEALTVASMSTSATGAHTGTGCEPAWEAASVLSAVSYDGLDPDAEYVLEGTLHLVGGGVAVDGSGRPVVASAPLSPEGPSGTAELAYDIDASGLAGASVVARERITHGGREVACATSEAPVSFPRVSVSMTDAATGLRESRASGSAGLAVEVSCEGLPGTGGATATCTVVDTATGEPVPLAGGREATASARLGDDGTASLALAVDTRGAAGGGVAAYVAVEADGATVATSPGVWDAGATVWIPETRSTVAVAGTDSRVAMAGDALRATVSYSGLLPGETHGLSCPLVDAATGEPVTGRDGRPIRADATLPAGPGEGTAELEVRLDADGLEGRTLALPESVTLGGVATAAAEASRGDGGRAVRVPRATVAARSAAFGDGLLPAVEGASADVVARVENVEPGLAYEVATSLVDAESGEEVPGTAGTAGVEPDGDVAEARATVTLDGRPLSGRTLVPTATFTLGGRAVAVARAGDEGSLGVPSLATELRAADGAKEVEAGAGLRLVDTVGYANLVPGAEYVVEGELVDAATGRAAVAAIGTGPTAATGRAPSATSPDAEARDSFAGRPDATTTWVADDGTYHLDRSCERASGRLRRTTLGVARAAGKLACPEESGAGARAETTPQATAAAGTGGEAREEERRSTVTARFTPRERSGTVEVEFDIDASGFGGRRLVALQALSRDGRPVADHRNASDAAQTVAVRGSGAGSAGSGGTEPMGQTGASVVPFALAGAALALLAAGVALVRDGRDGKGGE